MCDVFDQWSDNGCLGDNGRWLEQVIAPLTNRLPWWRRSKLAVEQSNNVDQSRQRKCYFSGDFSRSMRGGLRYWPFEPVFFPFLLCRSLRVIQAISNRRAVGWIELICTTAWTWWWSSACPPFGSNALNRFLIEATRLINCKCFSYRNTASSRLHSPLQSTR